MSIYAVNGKTPIAAWIPSRDDVGNGTTTLTDLVGSNNGTLTNMDPATDWVADTGAGGVRALDFDGVNDRVTANNSITGNPTVTISLWLFCLTSGRCAFGIGTGTGLGALRAIGVFLGLRGAGTISLEFAGNNPYAIAGASLNVWHHIAAVKTPGPINSTTAIYLNGSLGPVVGSPSTSTPNVSSGITAIGEFAGAASFWAGRLDDIRIWDVALDATDIADLYAGGFGRGITFGGTIQTRRRRQLGGYGL